MAKETLKDKLSQKQRLALAGWVALIFLLFSLPVVYGLTSSLNTMNDMGCPSYMGIVIHSAIVMAAMFAVISFVPLPIGKDN